MRYFGRRKLDGLGAIESDMECRWCKGTGKLKMLTTEVRCDCPAGRNSRKLTNEEKERVFARLLASPEGRRRLAEAMHQPVHAEREP